MTTEARATSFETGVLDEVTQQLYEVSREFVAPVITGFAHSLIEEADGTPVIFAARDALGTYMAADGLIKRFEYPGSSEEQLIYAYLTRKVIYGTDRSTLETYMNQLGIKREDDVILADIGMYGTIIPSIRDVLPNLQARYLVSRNPEIPGYADGLENTQRMHSLKNIMGNTAVHFLEDTFSGDMPSPTRLVRSGDLIVPNTLGATYPGTVLTRRQIALSAITDYVAELDCPPPNPDTEAIRRLDDFLSEPENYVPLMVPHER
jgi:hypothetical protein